MPDHATLRAAPKVLLHDHLDGGLRPATIVDLAAETGYDGLPTKDPDDLAAHIRRGADRRSLELYLETFAHTVGVLQTPEALARVAAECAEDLADDGVVAAEVRYAPELSTERGLTPDEVIRAVVEGFAVHADRIRIGLLVCAMRTADRSLEIAEAALRHRDAGVVGFDIAGAEAGFPPSDHAAAFALLRDAGLPFTIHAGESAGVESIADALRQGASRIGHGVRIADEVDAATGALGPIAAEVHERGVPLELCPTSNVHTGAVASVAAHPIERLRRRGFAVTLNTDNRLMSGVTATSELQAVSEAFGWGLAEAAEVAETAAAHLFLPPEERHRLVERVIRPGYLALQGSDDGR
jgi:adenosine deaminase